MRLRSSQIVLLLLLLCSAPLAETHALQFFPAAFGYVEGQELPAERGGGAAAAQMVRCKDERAGLLAETSGARSVVGRVWTVRAPVRQAAAVAGYTGFRRG